MRFGPFVTRSMITGVLAIALAAVVVGAGLTSARAENLSKLPDIRSKAAVVLDVRTGAEIWSKNADEVRAIASTTKIFVAMAVRRKGMALDGWTEIVREDARAATGGSRTRLDLGQTFKNRDLLRAMLMASDNRAPTALGRAAGLDRAALIAEMNATARELGLKKTRFTDTSGLRGNVSTAREMGLALRAALRDPVLAEIMGTSWATVTSKSGYAKLQYGSTNAPLVVGKYKVTGGKTGYTRAAGYCFVTGAEVGGRGYVLVFLGAEGKQTRFVDFNRVAGWLAAGAPGGALRPRATKAAASAPVRKRARGTARR